MKTDNVANNSTNSKNNDWFPVNTNAIKDIKIDMLRDKHGNDGWAFYTIMLMQIYKADNYTFKIDESNKDLIIYSLSKNMLITPEKFIEIRDFCLKINLFDKEEFEVNQILINDEIRKQSEIIEHKKKLNRERVNKHRKTKNQCNDYIMDKNTNTKPKIEKEIEKKLYDPYTEEEFILLKGKDRRIIALKLIEQLKEQMNTTPYIEDKARYILTDLRYTETKIQDFLDYYDLEQLYEGYMKMMLSKFEEPYIKKELIIDFKQTIDEELAKNKRIYA